MGEQPAINTHGMRIDFGKHAGERYTRVPVGYLLWMVNAGHEQAHIASAELERRGTVLPTMDISGHAIDRASLHCLDKWRKTRNKDEGINAWLIRMATEAFAEEPDRKGRRHYGGMMFAFEINGEWPVLKTVIREKSHEGSDSD